MGVSVGKCSHLCFLAHPHSSKNESSFSAPLQHPAHTPSAGADQGAGQCIFPLQFPPTDGAVGRTLLPNVFSIAGRRNEQRKERNSAKDTNSVSISSAFWRWPHGFSDLLDSGSDLESQTISSWPLMYLLFTLNLISVLCLPMECGQNPQPPQSLWKQTLT